MTDRRYARIYYDDLEREYPDVWRDPVLRGDYTLLLAVADRAWPASPEVPRLARPKAVKRLAELGLILLEPPYHYRCRGMDKHREERRRQAAHAASVRYADRTANSSAASTATAPARNLPNRAEPNRAETEPSLAEPTGAPDIVEDYYRLTNRFPNQKVSDWLETLVNEFGYEATSRKLATEFTRDHSPQTLLGRVRDELRSDDHKAKRAAAEAEKRRLEDFARRRDITPEQAADNRRRLAELHREWFGGKEAA